MTGRRLERCRRQFLIPLWNVYSFFVTYARLDGWTARAWRSGVSTPTTPKAPTPQSDNLLDRWILARLNQVSRRSTKRLDASDFMTPAMAVKPSWTT